MFILDCGDDILNELILTYFMFLVSEKCPFWTDSAAVTF